MSCSFKKLLGLLVIIFVTGVLNAVVYVQAAEQQKEVSLGLAQQIGNFYAWALGIGGLVALGVLVFGGILYTVSAGNASKQDDAKQWITGSIVGLIILFGSWFILNTINPELTKLKDLRLLANKATENTDTLDGYEPKIIDGATCPIAGSYNYSNDFSVPRADGIHGGIDIFAERGTPLVAIESGVINGRNAWVEGWQNSGGWRLWLYGDSGYRYYYAHQDSKDCVAKPGTRVEAGDPIGCVGNTGGRSGEGKREVGAREAGEPHLHLSMCRIDDPSPCPPGVNPFTEIPLSKICPQ